MLTWAQLGFHQKPCGLLNIHGYYDHLSAFLDVAVGQEFIDIAHRKMMLEDTSIAWAAGSIRAVYSGQNGQSGLGPGNDE